MRTRALSFALVLGSVWSSSPAGAGECDLRPLYASRLTTADVAIPPGGGVVIALGRLEGLVPSQPDLVKTRWKFVDGANQTAPVVRVLAPGLAVYQPPAGATAIALADGKQVIAKLRRTATATPLLPAPPVTAIVASTTEPRGPREEVQRSIDVTLSGPRPDDAVALVMFTEAGVATSWVPTVGYRGDKGTLAVYHSPHRCESEPPGVIALPAGARATVAWVDASGRFGARSKVFTIR